MHSEQSPPVRPSRCMSGRRWAECPYYAHGEAGQAMSAPGPASEPISFCHIRRLLCDDECCQLQRAASGGNRRNSQCRSEPAHRQRINRALGRLRISAPGMSVIKTVSFPENTSLCKIRFCRFQSRDFLHSKASAATKPSLHILNAGKFFSLELSSQYAKKTLRTTVKRF